MLISLIQYSLVFVGVEIPTAVGDAPSGLRVSLGGFPIEYVASLELRTLGISLSLLSTTVMATLALLRLSLTTN